MTNHRCTTNAPLAARLRGRFGKFSRDEDGALIIFAMMLFFLMVMMAGVAIDIMRYEASRTQLQNTLDRATLAAAALDQDLPPEDVVRDYFEKAGMSDKLEDVQVTDGLNFRDVKAMGTVDTKPFFLHMIGIEEFDAKGVAGARQAITNIELSLVLDVSGSMAGSKLANLKSAATEFVDTVLAADTDNRIAISLVPYNGQVNLGAPLRGKYNAVDQHGVANVNCIDLPASVYSTAGMSRTLGMPMTGHVDTYSTTNQANGFVSVNDGWATPNPANRWCPPNTNNIVRLPSNDVTTLQNQINGLTAVGATSINAGLKWGLALLDPGSRAMFSEFVTTGQIDAAFDGRPFDYPVDGDPTPETMKIIVLMTDGEHFAEERLNDGFRTGQSPIWRSNGDGNYSILHNRPNTSLDYWVPHRNEWRNAPWNSGSGVVQQTWVQVWERQRMSWVAWQLYARALGTTSSTRSAQYTAAMDAFRSRTPTGNMDTQLQTICTAAKDQNVIIYGIAFEAPSNGRAQIEACTSGESFYFEAAGLEIQTAFRSIASNITMLKLTQ